MASKPLLTLEKLQEGLDIYLDRLSYDELKDLLANLKTATTATELPRDLQDELNLMGHRIPKNLPQQIRTHVEGKVPAFCASKETLKVALSEAKDLLKREKSIQLSFPKQKKNGGKGGGESSFSRKESSDKSDTSDEEETESSNHSSSSDEERTKKKPKHSKIAKDYCDYLLKTTGLPKKWSKPASISLDTMGGAKILQVCGTVVVLSNCVTEIEKFLGENIDQVHLVAEEVVYIDHCLEQEKWHGVSVLVMAKKIECIPLQSELRWDLSGNPGNNNFPEKAKSGRNGEYPDGESGQPGEPGESGGHALFLAQKFENVHFLTIKSNGGRGQDGQNGGDGADGMDGHTGGFLDFSNFMQQFSKSGNLQCFPQIQQANSVNLTLVAAYLNTETKNFLGSVPANLLERKDGIGQLNLKLLASLKTCFLEGITRHNIHYNLIFTKTFRSHEALILFRGAVGSPGTLGGLGGLGGANGQGGLAGTVEAAKLGKKKGNHASPKPELVKGEDGKLGGEGDMGEDGHGGGKGFDYGYTFSSKIPKIVQDANLMIRTVGKNEKMAGKVWSEKDKQYVIIVQADAAAHQEQERHQREQLLQDREQRKNYRDQNRQQGHPIPPQLKIPIDRHAAEKEYAEVIKRDDIKEAFQNNNLEWWINRLMDNDENNNPKVSQNKGKGNKK